MLIGVDKGLLEGFKVGYEGFHLLHLLFDDC